MVWTCLAGPEIPAEIQTSLEKTLGPTLTSAMVACSREVTSCDVATLAAQIDAPTKLLHRQFRDCPSGCYFTQSYCDDFFMAINASMDALEAQCTSQGDFGVECTQMMRERDRRLQDETFEVGVMCSVMAPGPNFYRTPRCSAVVKSTIAAYPTLGNCPASSRDECIGHFCSLMAQFRWRIRPRNLQNPRAVDKYPASFVIPGCEAVERYPFENASCATRLDVHAYCDCLCGTVPAIQGLPAAECPTISDEFLLFGRLGVEDIRITSWCSGEVCSALDQRRSTPQCASYQLPALAECRAMHLPYVRNGVACPWLEDSGQDHILECMDGHRCSVLNDGWDCCEAHRGRGKCPRDVPLMCKILCGGAGQYCCKREGECEPRECSPIFMAEPVYQATTTSTTTTLPPPGSGSAGDTGGGLEVRLPQGWWVWLLLVVPTVVGIALVALWFRTRHLRQGVTGKLRANISPDCDGYGGFLRVRPSSDGKAQRQKPTVFIDLPELPETRPLGLELLETKVIRLHAWGQKCGFQVGDVIVDVGGVAVSTFEEIWERIQVERSRPPVRFAVERHGALEEDLQENVVPGSPAASKTGAAVAQAPKDREQVKEANELREAAAQEAWPVPNVPESPSGIRISSPHSSSAYSDSRADDIVLPEEDEPMSIRPRRQVQRLPPPVPQKSRFEAAFGKESTTDRLQEIIDRHSSRGGEKSREARWVRDAWGRSVLQSSQ